VLELKVRVMMGEKVETWKDLQVWQLAHRLALRVYEMANRFPSEERFRLTDQLCKAAISIPTNIAEGKGRNSLRKYLQFLYIARGSVEEVK
jgi:four helix bundle protein